eukprot:m.128841 g.128841  ORF g.128841 m.128841 type:complete len:354 (+) comp16748_c2_seq1:223-1284(+)
MGVCMSSEQREANARNAAIEKQLAAEKDKAARTVKLLLLGAGESGKSTLVKQMKIIHGDGFSPAELRSYKPTVCDNLVHSIRAVLEAMGALAINLGNSANRIHVKAVLSYIELGAQGGLPADLAAAIKALWQDSGVQECFRRANEYQLNDSAAYYFENIDRIAQPNYIPNQEDVLRARVRTTGIVQTTFQYSGMIYKMFDVGGQRSERRKWIQCFDDVTAVLFVAALSGYDLKLFEDQKTNRIHESLALFEAICNNKFFTNTAMILFLNKTDLFSQKIARVPLKNYFPEYEGPDGNAAAAKEFILGLFQKQNKNPHKAIYHHFTCATDTSNIRHVFDAVSDIIVERHLQDALM